MIIDDLSIRPFHDRRVFVYPILEDSKVHPLFAIINGFVLIDMDSGESYSLSVNHPEGIVHATDLAVLEGSKQVTCFNRTLVGYNYDVSTFLDAEVQYYLYTNQYCNFETPDILRHLYRLYPDCIKVGNLIGLQKHEQIAGELLDKIAVAEIQPGNQF